MRTTPFMGAVDLLLLDESISEEEAAEQAREQRRELQERIANVMLEVEGKGNLDFKKYIMVLVEEHDPSAWNVHLETLTPKIIEDVVASL